NTTFPRANTTRDMNGCGNVGANEQFALVSSYYNRADYGGSGQSALHTPNATYSVFRTSQPTVAQTFTVYFWNDSSSRCNHSSARDIFVYTIRGNDGASVQQFLSADPSPGQNVTVTIPASEFVLD